MNLIGIREGFATSSSSNHQIIIKKSLDKFIDYNEESFYSRNAFICSSRKAKIDYFYNTLISNFEYGTDKQKIKQSLDYVFGEDLNINYNIDDFYNVDHASCVIIPKNIKGEMDLEFYKYLINPIISNDHLAIIGDDDEYEIKDELRNKFKIEYYKDYKIFEYELYKMLIENYDILIRKEEFGWILFNKYNGNKYHISKNNTDILSLHKFSPNVYRPELVDMKISNYCPNNCAFCYQDSTKNGKHACAFTIKKIINILHELEVFEICLGGGEIVYHNNLFEILKFITKENIVVNITTSEYDIFKYYPFINELFNYIRVIGLTVMNLKKFKEYYYKYETTFRHFKNRIHIHYVLGLNPIEDLYDTIEFIDGKNFYNILLLGFKNTGRAKNINQIYYDDSNFIKTIFERYPNMKIGLDTLVINNYKNYLEEIDIDERSYYIKDGTYSKYIDAVDMTISDSSYSNIKNNFETWNSDKIKKLLIKGNINA